MCQSRWRLGQLERQNDSNAVAREAHARRFRATTFAVTTWTVAGCHIGTNSMELHFGQRQIKRVNGQALEAIDESGADHAHSAYSVVYAHSLFSTLRSMHYEHQFGWCELIHAARILWLLSGPRIWRTCRSLRGAHGPSVDLPLVTAVIVAARGCKHYDSPPFSFVHCHSFIAVTRLYSTNSASNSSCR